MEPVAGLPPPVSMGEGPSAKVMPQLTLSITPGRVKTGSVRIRSPALMQQLPSGTACRAALIVTDGWASAPAQSKLNLAKTNGWDYYFLGVGNQDAQNLEWMATQCGGTFLNTLAPPLNSSIYGGIKAAIDLFLDGAMKIDAPTNIGSK